MQTQCYFHGNSPYPPVPTVRMVYSASLVIEKIGLVTKRKKKNLSKPFLGDVKLAEVIIYFIEWSRHFSYIHQKEIWVNSRLPLSSYNWQFVAFKSWKEVNF